MFSSLPVPEIDNCDGISNGTPHVFQTLDGPYSMGYLAESVQTIAVTSPLDTQVVFGELAETIIDDNPCGGCLLRNAICKPLVYIVGGRVTILPRVHTIRDGKYLSN